MLFSRFRDEFGDRRNLGDLKGTDITETDLENLKGTNINEADLENKGTTSQAPEIFSETKSKDIEKYPIDVSGRVFGTITLTLDSIATIFLLIILFSIYLAGDRKAHAPEDARVIEHNRQLDNFLDTVTAFYCARGLGVVIDVVFRIWESGFYSGPRPKDQDEEEVWMKKYRRMLAAREWTIGLGRWVSTGLFLGLLWGKMGWWSRSVVKDWNEHHPKDEWVNIWN